MCDSSNIQVIQVRFKQGLLYCDFFITRLDFVHVFIWFVLCFTIIILYVYFLVFDDVLDIFSEKKTLYLF